MICPQLEDWRRFDLGQIDVCQQEEWAAHLEECRQCARLFQSLDESADDALLSRLRRSGWNGLRGDRSLQEMMHRAAELPAHAGSAPSTLAWQQQETQPPSSSNESERPDTTRLPEIPGFRLTRLLGRGGMGIVYQAEQLGLKRQVAIKTLREGQLADDEQVIRFHREAAAAAALDHPNIVPVFEVGQNAGLHYFCMAYVDGVSLERLACKEPLSVRRSAEVVQLLADAVHYAHLRGVVHRDLKPDNVLIDKQGTPRITDFGLARRIESDDSLTVTGQVMGTIGYMSPEQAAGRREVGPASDVYSLGAILYRLLVGTAPFGSGNVLEALQHVISTEPRRPRSLRPGLDRDIETICLKCLSKEASQRYSTAAELSADLNRYLNREPIVARPVGRAARVVRWCRRKPMTSAGVLLIVVMLTITAGALLQGRYDAARLEIQQHWTGLRTRLAELESFERDEAIEESILALQTANPEYGQQARDEVWNALRKLWKRRLSEPQRLSEADIQSLEEALLTLEAQQVPDVDELRLMLHRRRADWQTEFHLLASQSELPREFHSLALVRDGLLWPTGQASTKGTSIRWLAPMPSSTACEMQVEFADGWQAASLLGILLSADSLVGYEFVLVRTPAQAVLPWKLEIRREGSVLVSEPVQVSTSGPLRLWARRQQTQLSVQVANLPAWEFEDSLTLHTSGKLGFGLIWPAQVGVLEMRGRRRLLPQNATPLEEADQLFEHGDPDAALEVYQAMLTDASTTIPRGELLYKQGLCQSALGRDSVAIELYQEAMRLNDGKWSTQAACQLWQYYILKGDMQRAELVLDEARGLDFGYVATIVPSPVRQRILGAYRHSSGGIGTLLQFDPRRVEKARLVAEVESRLNRGGQPTPDTLFRLFEAYDFAGDTRSARQTLERILSSDTPGLRGYYVHHYLRHLRLSGDPRAASETKRFAAQLHGQDLWWLGLEQFRLLASRQEWQQARDSLLSLLAHDSESGAPKDMPAQSHLALGFLELHLGRSEEGMRIWRESSARLHDTFAGSGKLVGSDLMCYLAMAALADELTSDDVQLFVSQAEQSQGAVSTALQIIPRSTILNCMRTGWNSPRGRQLAEQLAFDQVSRPGQVRNSVQLLGATYCRLGAFSDPVSPQQEQFIWDLVGDIYQRGVVAGGLDAATVSGLLGVWADKLGTGPTLWKTVSRALPPDLRSRIAYVLGMRYASRGKLSVAETLLRESNEAAISTADGELQALVEKALTNQPTSSQDSARLE